VGRSSGGASVSDSGGEFGELLGAFQPTVLMKLPRLGQYVRCAFFDGNLECTLEDAIGSDACSLQRI
jgi:hypothetical protein